jgi:hypothetical protein
MLDMKRFLRKVGVAALHISAAWLSAFITLAYLVPYFKIAELIALVVLCFSFPVLVVGLLYVMFDGYEKIPPVAWVCVLMPVIAGLMLSVGIALG